jgi:hypothetical protein
MAGDTNGEVVIVETQLLLCVAFGTRGRDCVPVGVSLLIVYYKFHRFFGSTSNLFYVTLGSGALYAASV